jgi:hypothetical protein
MSKRADRERRKEYRSRWAATRSVLSIWVERSHAEAFAEICRAAGSSVSEMLRLDVIRIIMESGMGETVLSKMPTRRMGINESVVHVTSTGDELKLFVTANVSEAARVKEVFCANPMKGSDMEAIMTDGCILISLLLQAGVSVDYIVDKLGDLRKNADDPPGRPTSVLGTIVRAAKAIDDDLCRVRDNRLKVEGQVDL